MPNWWDPLLDSSQPSWAGLISGPTSMSALGFLGPMPTDEEVETDMWGDPIVPEGPEEGAEPAEAAAEAGAPAAPSSAQLDSIAAGELEVCDLVDCTDQTTADLAAQLERMLALEATALCDVVSCEDVLREREARSQATPGADGSGDADASPEQQLDDGEEPTDNNGELK